MDLIYIVLACVLIGLLVWALTTLVPMPPMYARAIQVVVLIVLLLWVITRVFDVPNVLLK